MLKQKKSLIALLIVTILVACSPADATPTVMPTATLTARSTNTTMATPISSTTATAVVTASSTTSPATATSPAQETAAPEFEPVVGLHLVVDGLTSPLALMPSGDDSGRLFIVDRAGKILILTAEGELVDEPFLDLSDRMVILNTDYDER